MTRASELVQALAEAMHEVQCLPGTKGYHKYSANHREPEQRRAALNLNPLAAAGHILSPVPVEAS
ncbi:hypothetical protein ACWT_5674 [Actinoplanes sp. SE50]|uniref:hypothetical protein n=1 Tax=unclassified Actinoplanes TaxID=2626549 RepID=UPI00023ED2C9|nr:MULTISPECIES: hypothetical protein [unclassified Actinoplanes]AEV86691.1 hypothetical protein ACPL_5804 [Actinoplanes sp. SE50/110]ATO85089.1 hypothetical protein ACWT_5674 [Actinoplanes sp. SE50]SLM02500.1 hypothetical protein ACSP50_5750 [Actinoplanes sp. SE50/110]